MKVLKWGTCLAAHSNLAASFLVSHRVFPFGVTGSVTRGTVVKYPSFMQ
jgi:hypothetical protein